MVLKVQIQKVAQSGFGFARHCTGVLPGPRLLGISRLARLLSTERWLGVHSQKCLIVMTLSQYLLDIDNILTESHIYRKQHNT